MKNLVAKNEFGMYADNNGVARVDSLAVADRVLVVMREEFAAFDKHLYTLMPEEQRIIIPLLNHSKNYNQLSDETGISLEALRKRASRIHKDFIEDMTAYFIDKI